MEKLDYSYLLKPIDGVNLVKYHSYFETYSNKENTRISLNGEYNYVYLDKFDDKYLDKDYPLKELKKILVPAHLELNGIGKPQYLNLVYPWEVYENIKYDEIPSKNPCIIYFKDIDIDSKDYDYVLEFNGFETGLYIYVNGKFVGYSNQNFENSQFDINKFISLGKNRICIVLFKYSFASWFKDQDMWRMSGIFRDVNLLKLNKKHLVEIKNDSILSEDYETGKLDLKIKVSDFNKDTSLALSVISPLGKTIFSDSIRLEGANALYTKSISKCLKWSDEEPNLYQVKIRLKEKDVVLEETLINVGFRKIEIKDGVIYLNNKRIVFKGVNRHEFVEDKGRVISKKITEFDIKKLKRNNFNAIRCSHYPNNPFFYDLCDKYGILVIDEAAIETHGTWSKKEQQLSRSALPCDDEEYLDFVISKANAMYERDKNHPCIVMWSLGNESFGGKVFKTMSNHLKGLDKTRLIHYEGVFHDIDYLDISDVYSRMYPSVKEIRKYLKKHKEKPYILCEFEHSMGNSTGNFDEYMKLSEDFLNFQGGFIWDYLDQEIKVGNKKYYGGDFNDYPNNDNFCADGIVFSSREDSPKMKVVKYFYQPLKFDVYKDKVRIINKYNFKNTNKLKFLYELYEDYVLVFNKSFEVNVLPNEYKDIVINNNVEFKEDKVYLARIKALSMGDNIFEKNEEIAFEEKFLTSSKEEGIKINTSIEDGSNLEVFKSNEHLTIKNDKFSVIFSGVDMDNGGLEAILVNDKLLLQNPVMPTLFRATIDNDAKFHKYFIRKYIGASLFPLYNPLIKPLKIIKINEKEVVVSFKYSMTKLFKDYFNVSYHVYSNGTIEVNYDYDLRFKLFKPDLIGLRFTFLKDFDEFSYIGYGKEETYIDRYKGVKYGKYHSKASEEYVPYSKPQECGNHAFSKKVSIKIDEENELSFIAKDKSFNFKYLPYNEFELEVARKEDELMSKKNYLIVASFNKGVGGDNSWGAEAHKPYLAKRQKYSLNFLIKLEKINSNE